jgi:transposase-like protein
MRRFKKALIERALGAELTHHLGYPAGAALPDDGANKRNGTTPKTVLTDDGTVEIDVPRDPVGSFAPALLPKHERRFTDVLGREQAVVNELVQDLGRYGLQRRVVTAAFASGHR